MAALDGAVARLFRDWGGGMATLVLAGLIGGCTQVEEVEMRRPDGATAICRSLPHVLMPNPRQNAPLLQCLRALEELGFRSATAETGRAARS